MNSVLPGNEVRRRPTLADVALLAGVSKGTASRALNGRGELAQDTRDRVFAAADELRFRPSSVAQNLTRGRSGTVGIITNDLEGRFVLPVLMGAEDALDAGGTAVILTDARGDSVRERRNVETLLDRQVDGLIVVGGSRTDPRPPLDGDIPVPVVYAYAPAEDDDQCSVVTDNVGGGWVIAEHLWQTGRRRVGFISGDPTYVASREREAGVRRALEGHGLEMVGGGSSTGAWNEKWGRAATAALLAEHEVDAIVAASDMLARAALDIVRQSGRSVPGDVAIAGHDNWNVIVENTRPELTSVDFQLETLGRRAAEHIVRALAGEALPQGVEKVPVRLEIRESTGLG